MSRIEKALSMYKNEPAKRNAGNPFTLSSLVDAPATMEDVERAWSHAVFPANAVAFWSACRSARLFEDVEYGQWGLVLLDPKSSSIRTKQERAARPKDTHVDDIVIGEFLGDQELLIIAPSEKGARRILIALPLDTRDHWFGAAESLDEFLEKYFQAGGDKFWER